MVVSPQTLQAANRIAHMDYPDTNTNGQTLDQLMADAQLVAGALLLEAAKASRG